MSLSSTPQPAPAQNELNASERPGSDESDDGASSASSDGSEPIETLVAGRSRRATAGNRMSHLIGQEEEGGEDDDVALLFAETGGEDVDFEDPGAQQRSGDGEGEDEEDDDDDDSSTDDEDKGPEDGGNELEGEQQLQKEERAAKKAQKRKAMAKPLAVRKRVKIDDSAATKAEGDEEAATRPRKKSERVSWLPTGEDAPTRTSSRTLSVQNKQRTMASMKESDARRAQTIKNMEVASQKKKQERARQMTQEERLEEAARVEEINTKSLTRWEEMEKERLERQRAKIAALQNRTLEGPVIRWYTGPAEKVGGRVTMLGEQTVVKEIVTAQHDLDAPKERKYVRKNKKPKEEPPVESTFPVAEGENVPKPEGATAVNPDEAVAATETPNILPANAEVSTEPLAESQKQSSQTDGIDTDAPSADEGKATEGKVEESKAERHEPPEVEKQQMQPEDDPSADQMNVDNSNMENPEVSGGLSQEEQPNEPEAENDAEQPTQESGETDELNPSAFSTNDDETTKTDTVMTDVEAGMESQNAEPEIEPISPPPGNEVAATAPAVGKSAEHHSAPPTLNDQATEQPSEVPATLPEARNPATPASQVEPTPQPLPQDGTTSVETPSAALEVPAGAQAPPLPPPDPIKTSQQTVTLLEFSENALNSLDASRRILFSPPPSLDPNAPAPLPIDAFIRPPKPVPQTCVITGTAARYRDPSTGLPYADRTAYAMIKRVLRGECRWSNLLGAWVGADVEMTEGVEKDVSNGQDVALVGIGGTRAARGVPLGFLDPASVPPPAPPTTAAAATATATSTSTSPSATREKSSHAAASQAEVKVEGGTAATTPTVTTAAV